MLEEEYIQKILELERIIKNDPLCIDIYKATKGVMKGYKSFDDRTFVRIDLY